MYHLTVSINVMPLLVSEAMFSAVPDNVPVNVTGKTSALPLMSRLIDTLSSFDEGELNFVDYLYQPLLQHM